MTDFEWAALSALVTAYGAPRIIEAVEEIASMAVGDDHENVTEPGDAPSVGGVHTATPLGRDGNRS